jgi:hypothetical protein
MTLFKKGAVAFLVVSVMSLYSCGGPNDNKGSMDEKNSNGEGAIDSTRITNFDSTSANKSTDTSIKK